MATNKDKFAVISRFEKLCKLNNFARLPLNKYAEQWASDALLQSYGQDRLYEIMDYYFKVNKSPTWKQFAILAGDLDKAMRLKEQDDVLRAKQRKLMKEILSES